MKRILFLSLLFMASTSFAQQKCFAGKHSYFKNFSELNLTTFQKLASVQQGCSELVNYPEMTEKLTIPERLFQSYQLSMAGLFGHGLSAFSGLNGDENEKAYKAQIEEIKKIPAPMTRIRLVYELAARSQGKYDDETRGFANLKSGFLIAWQSPANALYNARTRGTAGVCREMASLLQWSLLQVSRWSGSKSMALGPNDFSSNFIGATVPGMNGWKDSGGHAWVRVNMPEFDADGAISGFRRFDLDTTWYPEQFAPLVPRRSGLPAAERTKLVAQCSEVYDCLAAQARTEFYY